MFELLVVAIATIGCLSMRDGPRHRTHPLTTGTLSVRSIRIVIECPYKLNRARALMLREGPIAESDVGRIVFARTDDATVDAP